MAASRSTRRETSSKTRCRGKQRVGDDAPPAVQREGTHHAWNARAGPHESRRTSPPAPWPSPAPSWPSPRPRPSPMTPSGRPRAPPGSRASSTDGLMHNPNFGGFDDYGLSVDTGLRARRGRRSRATVARRSRTRSRPTSTPTSTRRPTSYMRTRWPSSRPAPTTTGNGAPDLFGGEQPGRPSSRRRVCRRGADRGTARGRGYTPGEQFDDDSPTPSARPTRRTR